PCRRGDLVGRPARRHQRGRAGVHRRSASAARDPPDSAARALPLPAAARFTGGVPALTLQMWLLLSAILFVGTHFLMSHPLREPLVGRVGEGPFRAIYVVVSLIT